MTELSFPHTHRERVEGCFRCDLSADEIGSPMSDLSQLDEDAECSFCGCSNNADGDWLTMYEAQGYGGDCPGNTDHVLCYLCERSYAVSAWHQTGRYEARDRDLMSMVNILLERLNRNA